VLTITEFIRQNKDRIIAEWESFAAANSPPACLDSAALRDHVGVILDAIADDLSRPQSASAALRKSQGDRPTEGIVASAKVHGAERRELGFELDQVAAEFRALRSSVIRLWEETLPMDSGRGDLTRFNEAIDEALIESIEAYTRRMTETHDQLLGILGHDLRNPVGVVMVAAGNLARQDVSPKQAAALRRSFSEAGRV
jgi:signal transduction histidine kinase